MPRLCASGEILKDARFSLGQPCVAMHMLCTIRSFVSLTNIGLVSTWSGDFVLAGRGRGYTAAACFSSIYLTCLGQLLCHGQPSCSCCVLTDRNCSIR